MIDKIPKIKLYSDGGARPNPGPGGYGIILEYNGNKKEFSGFEENTTNNRMELTGVIIGLEKLKTKSQVEVFTDSSYVVNGIEKGWAEKWKSNNWMRTKSEKAVNFDLWKKLLELTKKHEVNFNWVRGHNGHEENERCDELATQEILKNSKLFPPLTPPFQEGEQESDRKSIVLQNYFESPNYLKDIVLNLRKNPTNAEKYLWEILRGKKLNGIKFRRQHPFGRYVADFFSSELKLVIELDGKLHENTKQYDKIRDEIISKYGVKILRIKNEELFNNLENVIKNIINFLPPEGGKYPERGKGEKIKKPGDKCKKCGIPVEKKIPKKKNTKNKSYYYDYYLSCNNCKTNYFVEEAKVMLNKLDI